MAAAYLCAYTVVTGQQARLYKPIRGIGRAKTNWIDGRELQWSVYARHASTFTFILARYPGSWLTWEMTEWMINYKSCMLSFIYLLEEPRKAELLPKRQKKQRKKWKKAEGKRRETIDFAVCLSGILEMKCLFNERTCLSTKTAQEIAWEGKRIEKQRKTSVLKPLMLRLHSMFVGEWRLFVLILLIAEKMNSFVNRFIHHLPFLFASRVGVKNDIVPIQDNKPIHSSYSSSLNYVLKCQVGKSVSQTFSWRIRRIFYGMCSWNSSRLPFFQKFFA